MVGRFDLSAAYAMLRAPWAFLLVSILLFSVTAGLSGQDGEQSVERIPITVGDDRLAPGGSGVLRFTVPVPPGRPGEQSVEELELTLPTLPDRLSFREDGEVRRVQRDPDGGNRSVVRIELPFVARSAGRAVVPPILVDAPWARYRIDAALVEVPARRGGSDVPFDAAWSLPRESVFVGQTVPVFVELRNMPAFVLPDDVNVSAPTGALLQEVRGLGTVETRLVGDSTLYRYPAATYLLTPTLDEEVVLPAATVSAEGLSRRAQSTSLGVEPLPEAVAATGAVGSFRMSARLEPQEVPVGESAELTLRIEGTGNLLFLQFPAVEGEGLLVTETGTSTEVSPTEAGYRGSRSASYRITPQAGGSLELQIAAFPFVDPESGAVREQAGMTFRLNSLAAGDAEQGDGAVSTTLELLSIEEISSLEPLQLHRRLWLYLLAIPPVLAVFILAVLRRRVPRLAVLLGGVSVLLTAAAAPVPVDTLRDAARAFEEGAYPEARDQYRVAIERDPANAGIHYNLALAVARAGRTGEAVFHLRESVRLLPGFHRGWEALETVERRAGLERQVEPLRFPHPDYFAVALVVLLYVAAGVVILLWRTRQGFAAILLALSLGFLVLVGGALGYSIYTHERNVAVVSNTQAPLTKIPDGRAQPWLSLPGGTTVMPVARYGEFVLVRTGYGVEGWTRVPSIMARRLPEAR